MCYVCEKALGVFRIFSCDLGAIAWLIYDFCVLEIILWLNLGLVIYGSDFCYAYYNILKSHGL